MPIHLIMETPRKVNIGKSTVKGLSLKYAETHHMALMAHNSSPDIFSSFIFMGQLLETRIIHSSIADALIENEYNSPELRFANLTDNGILFSIVSLKKSCCDISKKNTLRKLKTIASTVQRMGGIVFFKIEPVDNSLKALVPWIDVACSAGFDGVELNLKGKSFRCFYQNLIKKNRKDAEKYFSERIQLIWDMAGPAFPMIYKLLTPLTEKGINSLRLVENFFTNNNLMLPESFHISMGMRKTDSFINEDRVRSGRPIFFSDYFHAVKNFRSAFSIPLILGGGLTSILAMNKIIQKDMCDLIALGRPLVHEPDIIPFLKNKKRNNFLCSLCNGCINPLPEPPICPSRHSGC